MKKYLLKIKVFLVSVTTILFAFSCATVPISQLEIENINTIKEMASNIQNTADAEIVKQVLEDYTNNPSNSNQDQKETDKTIYFIEKNIELAVARESLREVKSSLSGYGTTALILLVGGVAGSGYLFFEANNHFGMYQDALTTPIADYERYQVYQLTDLSVGIGIGALVSSAVTYFLIPKLLGIPNQIESREARVGTLLKDIEDAQ